MLSKTNLIIGGIVVLLFSLGVFFAGWKAKEYFQPCPVITTDTIKVTDPYWHHIADSLKGLPPKEKIKWLPQDTIFVPGDTIIEKVDTAAILKDYLSVYLFTHEFKTDTLDAIVGVTVTRNHPVKYELDYKILEPFETVINNIDNSVNYQSYLQAGIEMPLQKDAFNNFRVEATAIFPRWYGGAGWQPLTNTWSVRAGMTIFKLKTKK